LGITCFIDNDVILKLVTCNLFDEAIAAFDIDLSNIHVLETARFSMRSNKTKKNYSETVIEKAIATIKDFHTVEAQADNPLFDLKIPDMGDELKLIVAASAETSFYFATGDKRCLRALTGITELATMREKLSGRVICLEQIIMKIIQVYGFEVVKQKIIPARSCDKVLQSAFGSGEKTEERNTLEALNAYISEIEQKCPFLLAANP
jgi:hypothetical protein